MAKQDYIRIRGARVHNLKNVSVDIPKNKLAVITGVSGSGKSSLAFDTLYAEGQRRYVESLSAYARQFLGVMDKPDVDSIEGLSPAISIDQSASWRTKNPRSTAGTITEIYDYLRLLFARAGRPHCPQCGRPVARQSASEIADKIIKMPAGASLVILAPIIKDQKGEHKDVIKKLSGAGYARARVDGEIYKTDEALKLNQERYKRHSIEAVIDRVTIDPKDQDLRSRISESVEQSLKMGDGLMIASIVKSHGHEDQLFSESLACPYCALNFPDIEPRSFSFNSPHGACPRCTGLGHTLEIDPELVFPNKHLTLEEGAIRPWAAASHRVGRQGWYWYIVEELAGNMGFRTDVPVKELSDEAVDALLYGANSPRPKTKNLQLKTDFEGVIPNLLRRYRETESDFTRAEIERYMVEKTCPACTGARLKPEALAVKFLGRGIDEIVNLPIDQCRDFFAGIKGKNALRPQEEEIARPVIKEIINRLAFLLDVGLDYLTLSRSAATLSGGESQRIRLATQIGSGLTGVLYVLDEPSIGLHQRDQGRLIGTLKRLRDMGNTVVVVEHDEQTINSADWVIDVGPGAGKHGGEITLQGTPAQLRRSATLTGEYLAGKRRAQFPISNYQFLPPKADPPLAENKSKTTNYQPLTTNYLTIKGAAENNLKNITVKIPLGRFVVVSGVSGSGKSSLVNDILGRFLLQKFYGAKESPGRFRQIVGWDNLDKVVVVDQSPIGRTPRSNPATYTGAFGPIRDLFASTREAKIRGFEPGRFSFNVKGGRCEACEGQGVRKIEMHFLADVYVECEDCRGSRYNREALEVEYKGKNIAQILKMAVEEATEFFKNIPVLKQKLGTLLEVGLGYMELGQPATTLSGGEAQRVKLATELSRRDTGRTLYVLDEPTTGLHFEDVRKLLGVLRTLRDRGNTILVVEHNLDVIRAADHIIDLGPEGGDEGGKVVAVGSPAQVAQAKTSHTGRFLAKT